MKKTMKGFMIRGEWAPKPEYKLSETEKKRHLSYRSNMVWKNPTWGIETDIPIRDLKPTEVLMKIAACGVCGSDIHMLMKNPDGYMFFAGEAGLPVVVGHEFAGEVVEKGSEVETLKIGDLITAEEVQYCGICNPCRYGFYNSCKNMDQVGFDYPNHGAMAEYVIVDEKFCWSLNSLKRIYKDETKILEAGSLVEPTSVAYEGVFTVPGGIQSGGHVAVFGTGPIGLAAIQLLKTSGAALIFAFEPNKARRDLAKKMGADYVYDPIKEADSAVEEIMDLTEGNGIAMGAECAGEYDKTIPVMEKMLGVAGKITLIGMGPSQPKIDPMTYHRTGGSIYASLGHSGHGDFPSVINLMASGRIDMLPAITARYPLDQAEEGIKAAGALNDAKVLIIP